jgi:2-dehydro-3-deoxy-D-arabinonate dehydratase
MKIYKLTAGIYIEKEGKFYHAEVDDWDTFVNDDNLRSKLEWLTEEGRMDVPINFSDGSILPPIGKQELWACGVTYCEVRLEGRKNQKKQEVVIFTRACMKLTVRKFF